ncbi:serine hydrolase [Acidimangrovimonas sediminis]|uniref:serine hydrolase n=1 Tax=Acidimangrovimonas sediminis TaxID=2056283 RepID=UPI0013048070|nr:serine hydrolase [Acidimangrovimonas sediminis]
MTARQPTDIAAAILDLAQARSGGRLGPGDIGFVLRAYAAAPRLHDPGRFALDRCISHRPDAPIYPASVVKLFHLYQLAARDGDGSITLNDEDRRAARAMIELSSNEATAYLVGRLSGAFDGPWLDDPEALAAFGEARAAVQGWFDRRNDPDLAGIAVLHATYEDSPYGRARQIRATQGPNRLTARAGAALLHDIVRGAATGAPYMMTLLDRTAQRATFAETGRPAEGDQVRGFLGEGMPEGVRIWSKAGHTSWTRHDLLYAEAEGRAMLLSVMTDSGWSAEDTTFLPEVGRLCHDALMA